MLHIEQILFAEGKPIFVPCLEDKGWNLDIESFKRAITPKTKAILICCPMNPTGAVFSKQELKAIAQIAIDNNLYLIADEAYDFLVYDDLSYFSLASIPELKNNLIRFEGFRNVVGCAKLHGFHSRIDCAVGGHNNGCGLDTSVSCLF